MSKYEDYWHKTGQALRWQQTNYNQWEAVKDFGDIKWLKAFLHKHPGLVTVMDVGCGTGRAFPAFQNAGMEVEAIEFSDRLYPYAFNNKYGVAVYKKDIRQGKTKKKYDLVWCSQVLIHIPPQDAIKALKNMWAMTKKVMVIVTRNMPNKRPDGPDWDYGQGGLLNSYPHGHKALLKDLGIKRYKATDIKLDEKYTNTVYRICKKENGLLGRFRKGVE